MSPAWLTSPLGPVLEVNLAVAAGVMLVLALRRPVLAAFGARAAYGLWTLPLMAGLAMLVPARLAAPLAAAEPSQILTLDTVSAPAAPVLDPSLTLVIWLLGAALGLAWLVRSHLRFQAAERAGRAGPAVAGLLRPRIVLPADFETRFEPGERAAILAHERVHLRGQDSRINGLASLLLCLAWFNPLVHVAVRRLRLDQDLACDEAVLAERPGEARLYAATLLKAQVQAGALSAACAFGAHPLAERIALVGRRRPGRARRLAGLVLALGLGLGGGVAAWAALPARPAPVLAAFPSDRSPLLGAPAPREGPAIKAASRTPAARQLLAAAVPTTPEGETMNTTSPAPSRLAAAAVLALGLGTGSASAAAPQPATPAASYVTVAAQPAGVPASYMAVTGQPAGVPATYVAVTAQPAATSAQYVAVAALPTAVYAAAGQDRTTTYTTSPYVAVQAATPTPPPPPLPVPAAAVRAAPRSATPGQPPRTIVYSPRAAMPARPAVPRPPAIPARPPTPVLSGASDATRIVCRPAAGGQQCQASVRGGPFTTLSPEAVALLRQQGLLPDAAAQ